MSERRRTSPMGTARILAVALMTGPVMLWVIAWVLTEGGTRAITGGEPPFAPGAAFLFWAAVAALAFAVSLLTRRRALRKAREGEVGNVLSLLIVSWALLEMAAILSGVLFLLVGMVDLVIWGALTLFLGVTLTFPRKAWFK